MKPSALRVLVDELFTHLQTHFANHVTIKQARKITILVLLKVLVEFSLRIRIARERRKFAEAIRRDVKRFTARVHFC